MSIGLRITLIVVSFLTFMYMIRKIRKSQVRIVDIGFWILFSLVLICLALFPQVAGYIADILGIETIVNFVFLAVIFALLIEVFTISIKVSKLESKLIDLAGEIAIKSKKDNMKDK